MSELKRPEKYVEFESIKPKFKDLVEFYTNESQEYRKRILEFSEYADGLEKEIYILKDKPKIEILLDNTDKQIVVVPQIMADFIEVRKKSLKLYDAFQEIEECYCGDLYNFVFQKRNGQDLFARAWLDGCTVEKEKMYILKHIDLSEQDNIVSSYLAHSQNGKLQHERFSKDVDMSGIERCHFTQSEIDKLNIGSYEQIEVEP